MTYAQRHATDYQKMEINNADQFELILILYKGAIGKLHNAKQHLQSGEIESRVNALNKATAMIAELQTALDFERGGQIAKSLDKLYAYMIMRISKANLEQVSEPIDEVIKLLTTLLSAWEEARTIAANEKSSSKQKDTQQGDRMSIQKNGFERVSIGA